MKLMLIRTTMLADYAEPEDSWTTTVYMGIFYGWTAIKSTIKADLSASLQEHVDCYGGGDEAKSFFSEDLQRLKFFFKHKLTKLPDALGKSKLDHLTNRKYSYPMIELATFDVIDNDEARETCIYNVIAVK